MDVKINSDTHVGLIVILIIVAIIVLVYVRKHFKRLVLPNVFLVSGAVKSGKTLLSVHLAIKQYKKNLRRHKLRAFFLTCLGQKNSIPLPPMLYSNIPLAKIRYNNLTKDIIEQKVRIPNQSVVLVDEISLLADSFLYQDKKINNSLMRFFKLFAHYSHGGTLIVDTQSLSDCHFTLKRCIGSYLYIYERIKLPFISILKVREIAYSEDNSMISVSNQDIELEMRKVIVFNTSYKKYDCYCYSIFTDHKDFKVCYTKDIKSYRDDLKAYKLVSFQDFAKDINKEMQDIYFNDVPSVPIVEAASEVIEGEVINEEENKTI